MNKGLTLRTGQAHVNRWTDDLFRSIEQGQIDPSFVITHKRSLADGPRCTGRFVKSRTAVSRSCCSPPDHTQRTSQQGAIMSFMLSKISDVTRSPGDPKVLETGTSSIKPVDRFGRALGWFSRGWG